MREEHVIEVTTIKDEPNAAGTERYMLIDGVVMRFGYIYPPSNFKAGDVVEVLIRKVSPDTPLGVRDRG